MTTSSSTVRAASGIAWLVLGFVFLILSDATAKWLTASHSVVQIVCLRAAILVSCLIVFCVLRGRRQMLYPVNLKMQLWRAVLACGSVYLFIFGVSYVALAEASAAAYIGPIVMTALAPLMLGERVGVHRWGAVLAGFAGMLIMLRPSAHGIAWAMLLPASAAVFGALRDIITRQIRDTENPVSILLLSNLVIAVVGAPILVCYWQPFTQGQWALLALSTGLIGTAHLMHIQAFRLQEASVLAPFRYSGIIWAVLFGYLIWGELPDQWIVVGAIVVIVSGLYIYARERINANKSLQEGFK